MRHQMPLHAESFGDARGGVKFLFMTLAVIEGKGVAGESVAPGQSEAGGGIESAAQQTHCYSGVGHG